MLGMHGPVDGMKLLGRAWEASTREHTMGTLTKPHSGGGRSHLKLVHSVDDARVMTVAPTGRICDLNDPDPGPRDAAALVARFSRVLPHDVECDGVFSLGES